MTRRLGQKKGRPAPALSETFCTDQIESFGSRIFLPRYMPLFRSIWCGRRNSPESLSSTYAFAFSASEERRNPRFMREILLFGTAMVHTPNSIKKGSSKRERSIARARQRFLDAHIHSFIVFGHSQAQLFVSLRSNTLCKHQTPVHARELS